MAAEVGLKAQKLLAQGIALGSVDKSKVALNPRAWNSSPRR